MHGFFVDYICSTPYQFSWYVYESIEGMISFVKTQFGVVIRATLLIHLDTRSSFSLLGH